MKSGWSLFASNPYGDNLLAFRNPWIVMWWSAAFPGMGHFHLNNTFWGFFLMSFEYGVNTFCHINTAIVYSMLGQFDKAKEVLEWRFIILYVVVYVFAMWDSYRRCVDYNKIYQLAVHEKHAVPPMRLSPFELNLLDKKKPWLTLIWTIIFPINGYIYLNRMVAAIYSFLWWAVVIYFSNVLQALTFTAIGDFQSAVKVIDMQWLLYIPSIYTFALYDTYAKTVENNRIFEISQSLRLQSTYQQGNPDSWHESGGRNLHAYRSRL